MTSWSPSSHFQPVSFEESLEGPQDITHAVHCMLWAEDPVPLRGLDKDKSAELHPRAAVLMHVRHDGMLGFPGGKIDEPLKGLGIEDAKLIVTESLERELLEECNYDPAIHPIRWSNYLFSHRYVREVTGKPICGHFFARQLQLADLRELERRSLGSHEHGREVRGNVRVPLYTMSDGWRGLPAFLCHSFIGNAKGQLLEGLLRVGLLGVAEVEAAVAGEQSTFVVNKLV